MFIGNQTKTLKSKFLFDENINLEEKPNEKKSFLSFLKS